mgnify:CR=1 FL=1
MSPAPRTPAPVTVRTLYLPDFCAPRAVLAVVLIVELTALVLAMARDNDRVGFWTDLARTSLFLLWIGLASAGARVTAVDVSEVRLKRLEENMRRLGLDVSVVCVVACATVTVVAADALAP